MSYQPGDRLRVSFEAEVVHLGATTDSYVVRDVLSGEQYSIREKSGTLQIQQVGPPVRSFSPGDTIRDKVTNELISVGVGGYFSHATGEFVHVIGDPVFTSASYVEVPWTVGGGQRQAGKRLVSQDLQREFE